MTRRLRELKNLEGHHVSLALSDGTRIDDCELVSAGRGVGSAWIYTNSGDAFVPLVDVVDFWETPHRR